MEPMKPKSDAIKRRVKKLEAEKAKPLVEEPKPDEQSDEPADVNAGY